MDVGEGLPGEERAHPEQAGTEDEVGAPGRGHPQQGDEQGEEQQRRPEVALGDQDDEGEPPRQQDGAEMLEVGDHGGTDSVRGDRQQLALLDQVRGEEDAERHLGELAGLEADAAEPHPQPGPVDVASDDREQRHQQQADADQGERVAEALQVADPPHQDERSDEGADAEGRPHRLQPRQLVVEPGDEDIADAVEQGRQREQDPVGRRGQAAGGHVGDAEEGQDNTKEGPDVGGEGRRAAQAGQHVGPGREQPGQEDEAELGVAPDGAHDRRHGAAGGGGAVVVVAAAAARAWACCLIRFT